MRKAKVIPLPAVYPRRRELNIIATLTRRGRVVWTRRYVRLNTAIRRQTDAAVLHELEPRDVIQFAHENGKWLGEMKVGVGSLTSKWIWDKE